MSEEAMYLWWAYPASMDHYLCFERWEGLDLILFRPSGLCSSPGLLFPSVLLGWAGCQLQRTWPPECSQLSLQGESLHKMPFFMASSTLCLLSSIKCPLVSWPLISPHQQRPTSNSHSQQVSSVLWTWTSCFFLPSLPTPVCCKVYIPVQIPQLVFPFSSTPPQSE